MNVTSADNTVRRLALKANRLQDYTYTPKNIVLITVEDIIEIVHEVVPYTMSKLDEIHLREELLNRGSHE